MTEKEKINGMNKEELELLRSLARTGKEVVAREYETNLKLYFRKVEDQEGKEDTYTFPNVTIHGETLLTYGYENPDGKLLGKITVNFYGGYGARDEYGAEITVAKSGEIEVETLTEGYQGYDADTFRYPSKLITQGEDLLLEPAKAAANKFSDFEFLKEEAPTIAISKNGIKIGKTFIPMIQLLGQ